MTASWNTIPPGQQQQFLARSGLSSMPPLSAMDESQWTVLTGIIGEAAAQELRQAVESTPSEPTLPPPNDVGDWSDIMMLVAELRTKLGELQTKTASEDVAVQKDRIAEANKQEAEKIKECLEKLKKASTMGLLGKILGWVGAIVGLVAAAIATVATGGAAAPALAIAIMGVGIMVLQETGAMEKIVDFLAENPAVLFAAFAILGGGVGIALGGTLFGLMQGGVLDQDQAKMAIQIAISVAMLVASIAGMIASGGASATDAVFKIIGVAGQAFGGLVSVASGATGIAESAYSYQAADIQAEVQENKAWLAKLQQMLSEEMDRLQQMIDQLNAGVADASDMLSDIAESNRSIISNMGM